MICSFVRLFMKISIVPPNTVAGRSSGFLALPSFVPRAGGLGSASAGAAAAAAAAVKLRGVRSAAVRARLDPSAYCADR